MDPRRLLTDEWNTVERLIAATCHKRGLLDADADVFASMVKIKLFENDCEIVRRFRGESKFSTYLNIIIQHTFGDFCVKRMGKWHPSAAATRSGTLALELERMIHRDNCPRDEAISRLQTAHPDVGRDELLDLLSTIPPRTRRQTTISLECAHMDLPDDSSADTLVVENDRRVLSDRAAEIVRGFLQGLETNDRLLLQLHFEGEMALSKIARILGVPQKPLYRRREQMLHELYKRMTVAGINAAQVEDLIGHIPEDSDFGLRKEELRPTQSKRNVDRDPDDEETST